jgi:ligand-binding sensor domain-containing protein
MIRYLLAAVLLVLSAQAGAAQTAFPDWRAYPTLSNVEALDSRDGEIWGASGGGVFRYAPATGEVEAFTIVQGLFGREAQALATPAGSESVWIGYSNGTLDRLNAASGEVRRFRDIARADRFSQRGITRITAANERLYLATDFGVVVFDPAQGLVRETYSRFASLSSAIPTFDVALGGGRLYVATEEGLVSAPMDGRNLQDPASWSLQSGLGRVQVNAVEVFEGRIYAATASDLFVQSGGGAWQPLGLTSDGVRTLEVTADGRLIGVDRFGLIEVASGGAARIVRLAVPPSVTDVVALGDGLWLGTMGAGLVQGRLGQAAFEEQQRVSPPGPGTDLFTDLVFAADGTLWAAGFTTGLFGLLPDGDWVRGADVPLGTPDPTRNAFDLAPDPQGGVWAGTSGEGVVFRAPDGTVETYDRANSSLTGSALSNPNFIIVDGVAIDLDGSLWATNKFGSRTLHRRAPDGTWASLPIPIGDGLQPSFDGYADLMIDSFGQKWMLLQSEVDGSVGRGVVVYDTGRDPVDPSDDAFRLFTQNGTTQSLPSNTARDIAEDQNGRIWVATDRGVASLLSNGITARDPSAQFAWPQPGQGVRRFPLENVNATAIEIDLGGSIWVGSTEGIFVLRETSQQFPLVARYTVNNSPLPANRITALRVDPRTGTMFIATDGGLVSFSGTPEAPVAEAGDLRVYPNPVHAAALDGDGVTIGGLVAQTQLRIMTADGRLVWRDDTSGGSYVWNGRDLRGEPVPSGVYVVVAVGADGEGAGYGRVAILR